MSFVNSIVADLREKRLWPVALVLLAGLVAVPALLAKSGPPMNSATGATPTVPGSSTPGLPVVSVDSGAAQSQLPGTGRDPFTQQSLASGSGASPGTTLPGAGTSSTGVTTGGTGASSPASSGGSGGTAGSGGSSTGGGSGTSAGTNSTTTTTPASTTTTSTSTPEPSPPEPSPSGLTDTEAYHVTLSLTNSSGGLDTISPLERLAVLPSQRTPLLVELGVLEGGDRVLFAVQPGTGLKGRGTCTPGPIDCQILSLGQNQVETLSSASRADVAQMAITGIKAAHYRSSAAAGKARRQVSAAGRRLLSRSGLIALGLFQYEPGVGAVIDLRDLTIGGN